MHEAITDLDGEKLPLVPFIPFRCPRCRRHRPNTHGVRGRMRYHRCGHCGQHYRSMEIGLEFVHGWNGKPGAVAARAGSP
jgi:hypothetical protein